MTTFEKRFFICEVVSENGEYVDYNGRPLNLVGYITLNVEVGKQEMRGAKIVISRNGKKSLIGRDWLTKLNYRTIEAQNESEYKNIVNNIVRKLKSPSN